MRQPWRAPRPPAWPTANDKEIAAADFILSILPPGDALALAERFAPALQASNAKPVYVDCNAVNPKTVERVAAAIAPTECPFVDAGIIGSPPSPVPNPPPLAGEGRVGGSPRFYASGPAAPRFARLRDYGLDVRVLGGAASAASALKMSYAGITKGTQAIGAAMMLAAMRAGSADDLLAELQGSQKQLFPWLKRQLGADAAKSLSLGRRNAGDRRLRRRRPGSARPLQGAAEFYERFAEDFESGDKKAAAALAAFLGKSSS